MSLIMDRIPHSFTQPSPSSPAQDHHHQYRHPQQPHYPTAQPPPSAPYQHHASSQSHPHHRRPTVTVPSHLGSIVGKNYQRRDSAAVHDHHSLPPEHLREQLPISPGQSISTNWSSPRASPRAHGSFDPLTSPSVPGSATIQSSASWAAPTPPHSEPGSARIPGHLITHGLPSSASHPPTPFTPAGPSPMSVNYQLGGQFNSLGIDETTILPHMHGYETYRAPAHHGSQQDLTQQLPQSIPQQYDYSQAEMYSAAVRTSSPMPPTPGYAAEYRLSGGFEEHRPQAPHGYTTAMPPTSTPVATSSFTTAGSPAIYDTTLYGQAAHAMPAGMMQALPSPMAYGQPMYSPQNLQSMPRSMGSVGNLSASSNRMAATAAKKPQCWDHGCNGRRFSTFSNLLRHQREKSGTATKSYCPKCGAEFTRTTARNGHLAHEKCSKQRRSSPGPS